MKHRANGRTRVVIGTLAAVMACGGYAASAWSEDGWDGVSPNFGQSRALNKAIDEYEVMSRAQGVQLSQESSQQSQAGSTDMRASRLDRNHDGVVDVNEKQVSRDRVIQQDQNQSGQSQSGDRRGAGRSKHRRNQ